MAVSVDLRPHVSATSSFRSLGGICCWPVWQNVSDKQGCPSCPPGCCLPMLFSSFLPFLLSWPLPGSCQCLICIIHHGTQQPGSARLRNWHHHWRCDHLQVFDLLPVPKAFGDCNSILLFLQAAPEVTVNYQVTLSATSHGFEPVVQLVLDQHC